MYAKFQDKITNYLEDHMASLIKRTAKDSATIAEAYSKLKLSHAENQSKLKLADTRARLMDTQTKLKEKELENDLKNQEAEQRIAEGKQKETLLTQNTEIAKIIDANKKKVMETKSTDILRLCNSAANNITLDKDIFTALDNLEVYIWGVGGANMKMKGEISKDSTTLEEYNKDEFRMNIACSDMTNFNIEGIITSKLGNNWVDQENKTSGTLEQGIYRITLAGGKGGKGGGASSCGKKSYGGEGGNGDKKILVFVIKEQTSFSINVGIQGVDGRDHWSYGGCWSSTGDSGQNGGDSVLQLGNKTIVAEGGKGGGGGWQHKNSGSKGHNGAHGGNGQNNDKGSFKIEKYNYK